MGLTNSFFWSFIERFGVVMLTFFFNWLLSRFFLSPSDFGTIGMLYVFIALANATVIGGFGQALIQKKNPIDKDYNTVFIWNLILGFVLYLVLYSCSPLIADYYREPRLVELLRVMAITLILNSLIVVQNNILIKKLDFSKLAKINLLSSILGYLGGLTLAYKGYGVWSLVANTLLIQFFQAVLLWATSKWKPRLQFDKNSFKELFAFGGFMYLSSLLENLYSNFSYLIIGRLFPPATLGYFTQAEKLQNVPTNTVSTIINQVTFPLYSSIQDKKELLGAKFELNICLVAFINTSLMLLLYLIAEPLILFIFSDKWSDSIPIFKVLCVSGIFLPINTANTTILKAVGKGKLFFSLQVIKRGLGMILMIISSFYGFDAIIYSVVISLFCFWIINGIAVKKTIGYPFLRQLTNYIKSTVPIYTSFICTYYFIYLLDLKTSPLLIIIILVVFLLLISLVSIITNNMPFSFFLKLYKNKLHEH